MSTATYAPTNPAVSPNPQVAPYGLFGDLARTVAPVAGQAYGSIFGNQQAGVPPFGFPQGIAPFGAQQNLAPHAFQQGLSPYGVPQGLAPYGIPQGTHHLGAQPQAIHPIHQAQQIQQAQQAQQLLAQQAMIQQAVIQQAIAQQVAQHAAHLALTQQALQRQLSPYGQHPQAWPDPASGLGLAAWQTSPYQQSQQYGYGGAPLQANPMMSAYPYQSMWN